MKSPTEIYFQPEWIGYFFLAAFFLAVFANGTTASFLEAFLEAAFLAPAEASLIIL